MSITGFIFGLISFPILCTGTGWGILPATIGLIFSINGYKRRKRKFGVVAIIVNSVSISIVICILISDFLSYFNNKLDTSINQAIESGFQTSEKSTVPIPEDIEYIKVSAEELKNAMDKNALKAQNDYKEKYIEITGFLGAIDSDGKYISISSEKINFNSIHCNLNSDEQREIIMGMERKQPIIVRGYCNDTGEILGYNIDVIEIIPLEAEVGIETEDSEE